MSRGRPNNGTRICCHVFLSSLALLLALANMLNHNLSFWTYMQVSSSQLARKAKNILHIHLQTSY